MYTDYLKKSKILQTKFLKAEEECISNEIRNENVDYPYTYHNRYNVTESIATHHHRPNARSPARLNGK